MTEKESNKVKFTVVATKKDIVLNMFGNPVPGYIIRYITEKGSTGYVEIPEKEYSKERALKMIEEDVKRLEELL